MTRFNFSSSKLMRCFATGLLTTSLLADAAAISSSGQASEVLHQQQTANRTVSAALFNEIEESARLADIAYCVGTTGIHDPFGCLSHCKEFEGFELITTWNTGPLLSDSCGYVALSHSPYVKRIIIAFRGTYSLANTIVDLSAVPQTYVPYPADGDDDNNTSSNLNFAESKECLNCTVHAGFWSSWKNSRDTVLSAVTQAREQHPDYEVTLIGHSLGGAVAALAGMEMYTRGMNPQVTTFGEPKIGNDKMAEYINAMFDVSPSSSREGTAGGGNADAGAHMRYRRVTHVNDPVPLLPLTEWGYASHAGEIYISKLDLPPALDDLELCTGNSDERCIAGAEDGTDNGDQKTTGFPSLLTSAAQQQHQNYPQIQLSEDNKEEEEENQKLTAQWSLLPARYRMWELFFAHRDYFWRIGLCVPGGDPSSWRFFGKRETSDTLQK